MFRSVNRMALKVMAFATNPDKLSSIPGENPFGKLFVISIQEPWHVCTRKHTQKCTHQNSITFFLKAQEFKANLGSIKPCLSHRASAEEMAQRFKKTLSSVQGWPSPLIPSLERHADRCKCKACWDFIKLIRRCLRQAFTQCTKRLSQQKLAWSM